MKLTDNFWLSEFTTSITAKRKGINNTPSPTVVDNLRNLSHTLEKIRALLGVSIHINSGYRSLELNRAVGGSMTSAHLYGWAADFTAPRYGDVHEIVKAVKDSGIEYDQLIAEGGPDGWVHISIDPRKRKQTLVATFLNGKAIYRAFA